MKRGGRLAITDIVATAPLPDVVKKNLELHTGCVAGAAQVTELESMLEKVGFTDIRITPIDGSKELIRQWFKESHAGDFIVSATIEAVKA